MCLFRPRRQTPIRKRIGPKRLRERCFLGWIILILLLLTSVPVLSFGQQEDLLSQADSLIEEKRYTEALSILTEFARNNPDKFDAAQVRINRILFVKETYTRQAQNLLDLLEEPEPKDDEILALTNYLLALDPERSAETQDFFNRTMGSALFRSNSRRLNTILAQGQELVDRGSYAEALRTYAGGFSIYQAEFFTSGYGTAMENRTRQGIAAINNNIAAITSATNALEEAVNALAALSSQGVEPQNLVTYRNAYIRLSTEMERFTTLRNTFSNTNAVFRDDLALLRRNYPQNGDRNFLAFAVRLMEGRSEAQGGMLGVFDTIWLSAIPRARDLLDQKSQAAYIAIVTGASSQAYETLGTRSETLVGYGSLPENLEILWGRYDLAQKANIFGATVPAGEAGNYLKFRYLTESSVQWRTLGQLGNRFSAVPRQDTVVLWRNGGNGDELMRSEQNTINLLRQIRTETRTLLGTIQQRGTEYRNQESRYPSSGAIAYLNGIISATEELLNMITISEESSSADGI